MAGNYRFLYQFPLHKLEFISLPAQRALIRNNPTGREEMREKG